MASPLAPLREALASAIASSQGLSSDRVPELARQVREPDPEHGDLSFACFQLASELGCQAPDLAKELSTQMASDSRFSKVEAVGPYLNVMLSARALAETVIPPARQPGFLRTSRGAGKTVVIDFSSPNIAKPLGFHHIRSTVIGAAIGRLHEAQGWTVVRLNYLGDWGKQFGLLATGFERHGNPDRQRDAKHLVEVYVKANADADVARLKQRVERPSKMLELADALRKARAANAEDPKQAKQLKRRIKTLERKLREGRPIPERQDPLVGLENHVAELERDAKAAAAELPVAEAYDREARAFLKRMESGDRAALELWKRYRATSIEDFERVYDRLGVSFTNLEGESLYQDRLDTTIERVRERPGTRLDEGAEVIDLPAKPNQPPSILRTRDGTTLYLTRDIAAAIDRYERFHFERSLYVVGADQSLHFEQLSDALEAMGFGWSERIHHVPFGRIHGMSTRRGNLVFLDEVLEEATSRAREICESSDKVQLENIDDLVEAVGVGAVVFADLKNLRTTDYTFDWNEILQFTGHTGPYVQFSHARACSILRKAEDTPSTSDLSRLTLEEERIVLRALAKAPEVVERACETYEPSLVARHLLELSQATATYFTAGNQDRSKRVLVDNDERTRVARLALVEAIRCVLEAELRLLGLQAPEAM
jgi:arginyl-tRNA synthetase